MNTRGIEDIRLAIGEIKEAYNKNPNNIPASKLKDLQNALNRFFTDAKCYEVLYTNNTDKLFFGMCIMPKLDNKDIEELILSDDPFRIVGYYIEIDSRILDPLLGLTVRELTACVLHEVGHIVNTATPIDEVRKELDIYLADTNQTIDINKSLANRELILFGIKDSVRKIASMFENPNKEEIIADQFAIECGYGDDLVSALKKIIKHAPHLNNDVPNKFIVFSWALRIYQNIGERRMVATKTLNKTEKITGSTLVKREIKNVSAHINKLESFTESDDRTKMSAKYRFKYDILRKYEDDYYECALRLKSANLEDDALRLLRDINTRMSVIEEFINGSELSSTDRTRFSKLYDKYMDLRDALAKKDIKKERLLGLWVEYPEFQ